MNLQKDQYLCKHTSPEPVLLSQWAAGKVSPMDICRCPVSMVAGSKLQTIKHVRYSNFCSRVTITSLANALNSARPVSHHGFSSFTQQNKMKPQNKMEPSY